VVLGHVALTERFRAEQQTLLDSNPRGTETWSPSLDRIHGQEREILTFASLAELTGGRSYGPPQITLTVMRQVLGGPVGVLRTEYTVGFVPETSAAPRKHQLEVRWRDKEMGRVIGGSRTLVH